MRWSDRPAELGRRPRTQGTPAHDPPLDTEHPHQPRGHGLRSLVALTGPVRELLLQPRFVPGEFVHGGLPAPGQRGERGRLDLREPLLGQPAVTAGRHVLDQPGTGLRGDGEPGRRVHHGGQPGREHEHGVPHAVHPHQRLVFVQRPLDLRHRPPGIRQPRADRQIHRRRIGPVQRDQRPGDLLGALRPRGHREPMPQREPSPPLRHPDVPPLSAHASPPTRSTPSFPSPSSRAPHPIAVPGMRTPRSPP